MEDQKKAIGMLRTDMRFVYVTLLILSIAVIVLAVTGCAIFDSLFGPTADPGAREQTQMTLMALVGPPFNLAIPAVFGILTALFAPKEPQL